MAKDGEGADQSLLDHGTNAPSSTPGPPTHSRVKKDVRKIGYVEWLTTSYSKPYDPATDDFWWVDRAAPSSDGGEPPRCWLADLYVAHATLTKKLNRRRRRRVFFFASASAREGVGGSAVTPKTGGASIHKRGGARRDRPPRVCSSRRERHRRTSHAATTPSPSPAAAAPL